MKFMIRLILLFEIKEFWRWIGWFLLIGLKSIFLRLSSFLVLFLFKIVWEFVFDEIVKVIWDGILVLIRLEMMLMDGCWVVRIMWIFAVCVFCLRWMIVFFIFLLVIIIRLVNLFIIIIMSGSGICLYLDWVLNFFILVLKFVIFWIFILVKSL